MDPQLHSRTSSLIKISKAILVVALALLVCTMESKSLHIVVFPWLAFGHMIPFLELSKRLASKGHRISFVSTPQNLHRLPKIPQKLTPFISLMALPLPKDDQIYDLPPNAESTMDVSLDKVQFLKKAYDDLRHPMSQFLETASPMVDWIIYDFAGHWLPPIANQFGIRKAFFYISNAWTLSFFGPISHLLDECDTWTKPEDLTKPPDWIPFPNPPVYRLYEAEPIMGVTKKNASGSSDVLRIGASINGCDVMAVRSCVELEAEYLQLVENLEEKAVFPIGLLPVDDEDDDDDNERYEDDTWQSVIGWLEKQRNGSVVYVALGSEVTPSQDQITELARGLEMSQVPFLWAWRKPAGGSAELPDGFEERTKDHGLVLKKWAPQPKILSHDSVGAFLTHGGWSSVIEGLQFGKPLIMISMTWDLNTRIMAAKKVGIEIPRNEEDGSFTKSSVAESLNEVLRDETAKLYKEEANKISKIFGNLSLHRQYIEKFEQYLSQNVPKN